MDARRQNFASIRMGKNIARALNSVVGMRVVFNRDATIGGKSAKKGRRK